ncbi:MAG TPA: RodZ domain-containing protein [Acidimicrobiales bacterium]|nr:RodZ domain-containing protein [Acidimicrobiales bacterium]
MKPLLVVLAVACFLGVAVHFARSAIARARSVERHRQALDILAGITSSQATTTGVRPATEHPDTQGQQAHVRLLAPGSETENALPPPRPFARTSGRSSPFRRPSQRPGFAATAVVPPDSLVRPGQARRLVRAGADGPGPEARPTRVLPVVAPPPPPSGPSRSPAGDTLPRRTDRPIAGSPIAPGTPQVDGEAPEQGRPHVFYFDDVPGTASSAAPALVARPGSEDVEPPPTVALGDEAVEDPVTEPVRAVSPPRYVPVNRAQAPSQTGDPAEGAGEALITEEAAPSGPAASTAPAPGPAKAGPAATARRPQRVLALAAASTALVGAAIGISVLAGGGGGASPSASGPPSRPPTSAPTRSVPSTTASSPPASTTTTPPARPASLVSATAGSATYQLRSPHASIVVKASGPCWIEVKAGSPQGQVVYEGTLAAGQTSSVTGPAWIRLGDPPNASVAVNGTRMHVPGSEAAVPIDLQFTVG